MKATGQHEREAFCDLEIWTRAKCGLRVRARGRLDLGEFLKLSDVQRGEAISRLLFGAAAEIAAKVEAMDKETDAAKKRADNDEN